MPPLAWPCALLLADLAPNRAAEFRETSADALTRVIFRSDAGMRRVPGAEFWNGDAANIIQPHAFWDALHMRWPAAQEYSKALAEAFRYGRPPATGGRAAIASAP